MIKVFGVGFGIALMIAIAVLMPFLTIWSVNTLFSLTIPYTLETWSAVCLLGIFFRGDGIKFSKKD